MSTWLNRIVSGGILLLILVTPMAFGSVHPRAYSWMEAVIFLLVAVWCLKGIVRGEGLGVRRDRLTPHALPLTLFILLVLFQLMPLPPSVLKVLSPATYELYSNVLPGWPDVVPYGDVPQIRNQKSAVSSSEIRNPTPDTRHVTSDTRLLPQTWLPLSVAPDRTRTELLKYVAYAALFFLILLYPFSGETQRSEVRDQTSEGGEKFAIRNPQSEISNPTPETRHLTPEDRFLRSVLQAVLLAGALVAAIGFAQQFAWNGKILWSFVPYDWGAPRPGGISRASGPFINPNHFANYLALIFPVAVACALFRNYMVSESAEKNLRIFLALTALLLFTGILLSLSRSGWISAFLSLVVLLYLSRWRGGRGERETANTRNLKPDTRHPILSLTPRASRLTPIAWAIVFSCLLIVSLFIVGPAGRGRLDSRLDETLATNASLLGRTAVWKDTFLMIGQFPIFGVGLAAWPEMFPRYRRAPWSPDFFREAHNDYIQVLAETGVTGFGLLAWFFMRAGRTIFHGVKQVSSTSLALLAALVAALAGMAFHEFFDFNLHIPANAFLFTVFFALAVRVAVGRMSEVRDQKSEGMKIRSPKSEIRNVVSRLTPHASRLTPHAVAVAALVLAACALRQDQTPYPYNLDEPHSVEQAKEFILAHPTHAPYHLALLRLIGGETPLSRQLTESKAALWIEPSNPYFRDYYAATLLSMGKQDEGLREVKRSVADAPYVERHHLYLSDNFLSSLSPVEQQAVEAGFKEALARGYPETLQNLAGYYGKLGRFYDQGILYEQAGLAEKERPKEGDLLLSAGVAYVMVPDAAKAELLLRKAIAAAPNDIRAYQQLTGVIYKKRKDLGDLSQIISEGEKHGVPPFALYLSLAETAQIAGNRGDVKLALDAAKAEIDRASKRGEDPYPLYISLADIAAKTGDRDEERAALLQAVALRPRSSDTLFRLADLYLAQQKYDRAALYLNQIVSVDPDSADAYYRLGIAEEGRYRFADANRAYARAVELAPQNDSYRHTYQALVDRVAQNRSVEMR